MKLSVIKMFIQQLHLIMHFTIGLMGYIGPLTLTLAAA